MTTNQTGYSRSSFYWELRRHMEAWPGFSGQNPPFWDSWTDGIYEDYRRLARETVKADSLVLHSYAAHLLSSQSFAFNLFLPFINGNREKLSRCFGGLIGEEFYIDRVVFEWVPPGHLLGEIDGDRPYPKEPATAVDVVMWGWLPGGGRAAVLVEVKLSENRVYPLRGP